MTDRQQKNYNVVIRKDGKVFKIPKELDYGNKIPEDEYCIQYGDRPCAFRSEYFDIHGGLRKEYWDLEKL